MVAVPPHVWKLVSITLAILWIVSLFIPVAAQQTYGGPSWVRGWELLTIGWMGPFIGQFGWFANILIWITLACLARTVGPSEGFTFWLAGSLLLLTINSAFWSTIPDSAGRHPIVAFGAGYYLWMCAVGVSGVALILRTFLDGRSREE